jgi:hypothetical protein
VYDEQAVEQEGAGVHASCGFLLHGEIGYPHENAKSDFVGGRLLQVGAERRVVRQGVHYIGVRLRARIEGEWSGYAVGHRSGERFSRTIDDIVWLQQLPDGRWALPKPSLILDAALAADILIDPAPRARSTSALAPPPDPQLLTHAEQQAADTRDYHASLRTPEQGQLSCRGHATVYHDSRDDFYGSGRNRSPNGDIDQVAVVYPGLGGGACVSVTFTTPPRPPLAIDFSPAGVDLLDVQVYMIGGGRVRAGTMSGDQYQVAKPPPGDPFSSQALYPQTVTAVAVSKRTVSFRVAPDTVLGIHPTASSGAKPLRWLVRVTVPQRGSDVVPGANPSTSENLAVDQTTGKVVDRY